MSTHYRKQPPALDGSSPNRAAPDTGALIAGATIVIAGAILAALLAIGPPPI